MANNGVTRNDYLECKFQWRKLGQIGKDTIIVTLYYIYKYNQFNIVFTKPKQTSVIKDPVTFFSFRIQPVRMTYF